MRHIMTKNSESGVIYCTSGKKYFDDAVVSARSFKRLHPEKKVAIFTEEDSFRHEIFDYHLPIFSSQDEIDWVNRYYEKQPKKWMLKVICTPKSPFAKTVHLDSDTLVVQRIDPLFDDLDDYDIILTHLDWVKQEKGVNVGLLGLTVPKGINSGVYAFTRSEAALKVMGPQWREVCEREGFTRNEQSILSEFIRNPDEYLAGVRWKVADNVKYNATRRMWRSMYEYGLWDDVCVLHFNETDKLADVFEGRLVQDDLLKLPRVQECDPKNLEVIPKRNKAALVHFHLAKTAGKSLLKSIREHIGDQAVSFNPAKQEQFRDRLRQGNWKLISGHLSAGHSPVQNRLKNRYQFFTVLRNPVDRFHSAYNYIRQTQVSKLYELFNDMSPIEAARYCVEKKLDYGRNSQCSGVIWDPSMKPTFEHAMMAIDDRYAFVCTLEQMRDLGQFLYQNDMIKTADAIPHVNKTREVDVNLRKELAEVLKGSTSEDFRLYQHVLENGPLRQ